ncbi:MULTISPECIES: hypothetical protein [Pseudanabaena]|uniref:hypothetical protein n=1 Tax=Pseudanabaena TaxID=1152 RepID=UPI0024794E93|nr:MULTISPECIES: hypothetical protein [Pseudanabaena]MEA5488518.1 hypothetical protein [Pseudanabaena sp. CCNP1317]WGS71918.1 hypothetical protein OA858_19780 [Pseudanabaena galeata CCNP1313]
MLFKILSIVKLENIESLELQGAEKIVVVNEHEVWVQAVDFALRDWSQGDCVIGEQWFVFRFNPQCPLTPESIDVAQEDADLTESKVKGLVVVTQTCDIVRSCKERPFVEVVPLVEVGTQLLSEIKRIRRPRYAYIPGVEEFNLVADLDLVMTVEKGVVAQWNRKLGCPTDDDVRSFGQALARKRSRFAFPDDFNDFAKKLQTRLRDKHSKATDEGEALRALREIRVRAEPSWSDSQVHLLFWFIRHEDQIQFKGIEWNQLLKQWLKLIPDTGRFYVDGLVVALEDMTAKDYIESDSLDLDHLSS